MQIRFHDTRHCFASWLIGAGESLAYVKDQLGHHSIQITVDTYSHLIPGSNREAVNRLAGIFEPHVDAIKRRDSPKSANPLNFMVGHVGFEPTTS